MWAGVGPSAEGPLSQSWPPPQIVEARGGSTASLEAYSVVVDAGSTGSRVHVFRLDRASGHLLDEAEVEHTTTPGISACAANRSLLPTLLGPLLSAAEDAVPKALRRSILGGSSRGIGRWRPRSPLAGPKLGQPELRPEQRALKARIRAEVRFSGPSVRDQADVESPEAIWRGSSRRIGSNAISGLFAPRLDRLRR